MGDDRPFVCSAPGCGQRFTNEDHLAVHKHKHEMTLKFGPGRDGVIVADQTPTPTRFLKNCEEVGLFTELANPFEQEFKKADEDEGKKSPLDVSLSPVPEGKIKEDERIFQGGNRSHGSVNHPLSGSTDVKDQPPKRPGNTTTTIVRPGSLLLAYDSGHSVPPTLPSPTSVITPTPPSNRMLSSPTGPVPVLLHLPNGQTMPVNVSSPTLQIPTVISIARPGSVVPNIPGIPGPTCNSSEPHSPSAPTHIDTKMRLKSALALQTHPVLNGNIMCSMVTTHHSQISSPLPIALSPPQLQLSPSQHSGSSGGGRRRRGVEEDPDERRRRFLERNRAAASRCRQKRKVWVTSLEKKAEELSHMNVQLQNEVRLLRNEVAQLKQLLLAHKDCPVTTIQKRTQEFIGPSLPPPNVQPWLLGLVPVASMSGTMWYIMESVQSKYSLSERLIRTIALRSLPHDNVEDLIDRGADVNCTHGTLKPLHCACMVSDPDCVELLLEKGAEVNARDGYHRAALHYAAERDAGCVEVLLRSGADPDGPDGNLDTPLHWAAYRDNARSAQALLEGGARVDPRDYNDDTPLSWAASRGNLPSARVLLEYGADVRARNLKGQTPASRTRALLGRGADGERERACLGLLMRAGARGDGAGAPLSLRGLSRYAVRRALGATHLPVAVETLPLPPALKVDLLLG